MKPVAVIILNWNGRKLLKQFLPSVVKGTNKMIADVIVADNGSHDKSIDYINDNFPEVKIIRFEKNLGFAQGYNEAIKQTDYKYTLLLNNDVAVPEGWLEPLYDFMENNPTVGACQPKLLSYENRKMFEYAGASGGFIDRNGFPYCRGRIFSHVEHDHEQYDNTTTVFWASGAALMVRTELYNRVGGLDPLFFAHMEEIDLCWRIHLQGCDVAVVPQSQVYHLGGGSLPASNPKKTYLNFRNNLLLLYKNTPADVRDRIVRRRMIWDALAFTMFAGTFQFKNASAVIRAHRDYRQMKKNYTTLKAPEKNLLGPFKGSRVNIITSFYLCRRRRYRSLKNL